MERTDARADARVLSRRRAVNAPVIAINGLTKRYRNLVAVDGLSLELAAGSVCGLLGPNGAGKTTTFKCLLGFTPPTAGTIAIEGAPVGPSTFASLAYVPERAGFFEHLTVADHLELQRRSFAAYDAARARELVALFGLDVRQRVRRLSKGMHTALSLVLAFSIRPRVLVLDEPSSGLDPIHQRNVLDLIIDAAANGATVLFSSHQVTQVERAADRVAILKRGRLVVDRSIDELKTDEKIVEAIFAGPLPALHAFAGDPRISRVETVGATVRLVTRSDSDEIAQQLFALRPRSLQIVDLNLEEIFLNAVTEGSHGAG
jgi:ABC-2 type transport system ATP-binding protein